MAGLGSQLPKSHQTNNMWPQRAPGPAVAAARLDSQFGFSQESPSPAQVTAISDCSLDHAGGPRQNSSAGGP